MLNEMVWLFTKLGSSSPKSPSIWRRLMMGEKSSADIEKGMHPPHAVDESDDGSICFSDAEDQSWHSPYSSHCAGSSFNEFRLSCASGSEIGRDPESSRNSCVFDCSLEVDLECELPEIKANAEKADKDCRICHLSLDGTPESGIPIELGCSCKHDLAAAHKQCAETWFKIRGNNTCEICGSPANNVVVGTRETEFIGQWNETSSNPPPALPAQTRSSWDRQRFLNFLLTCMAFAFVISWFFHFNVLG